MVGLSFCKSQDKSDKNVNISVIIMPTVHYLKALCTTT